MVDLSDPGMPQVFLSYGSAERPRALALADALEAAGIGVWIDRQAIPGGSSWSAEIVRAIQGAAVVAVLGSQQAYRSPNVQRELNLAVEENKPLLPLLLDTAPAPAEVRYALAGRQWIELLARPQDAWLPDVLRALARLGVAPRPVSALRADVASVDGARTVRTNLPATLTDLIGRERELAQVRERLARHRLVTLTGPGGTGKTRLALAVAASFLDEPAAESRFPDGVWLVELDRITEPAGVAPAIGQALGLSGDAQQPATELLKTFLRSRQLLLVLDNFEQVLDAAALVRELLQACAGLRLLATSRAAVHVAGEHEYAVPPLALPGSDASLTETKRSPAVALFVERAQAVRDGFALTEENAAAVAAICALLDGLPLAIELAAARVKLLPPAALLQRLQGGLTILAAGDRSLPERQQTLRGAVRWSYELLSTDERAIFRRLAVFAGGCTLEAAEAVCSPNGTLDVFEGLASLVDKSLVQQRGEAAPRFVMLNVVREFALEELAEAGELDETRAEHARYYHAFAEANTQEWGRRRDVNIAALEPEIDNFRALFEWAAAGGDLQIAMDTVGLLLRLPSERDWIEGGRWALRLVALDEDARPTLARARALVLAACTALVAGDYARARPAYAEAIPILREHPEARTSLIQALAMYSAILNAEPEATAMVEDAVRLAREFGDPYWLGLALGYLSWKLRNTGDLERSDATAQECLALYGPLPVQSPLHSLTAFPLQELGINAILRRDFDTALSYLRRGRELARGFNSVVQANTLDAQGLALIGLERLDEAEATFAEALRTAERIASYPRVSTALQGLAAVAELRGQHERAALLFGASGATRSGVPRAPLADQMIVSARASARAALGEERFQQLRRDGEALELSELMRMAAALNPPTSYPQ